ncbi:MAG: protein tyrosine phosphatase [Pseudomonadota bacterium]
MPAPMTEEEFQTPEGRKAAWRSLMLQDHGFLRKVYDNSHWISDEMVRTYQPSPAMIEKWADKGIRTIINLRGVRNEGYDGPSDRQPGFYWLEKEACAKHGIRMIDHRAWSREAPPREFITGLNEIFETIEYPALMHCKSGADRAGIASTLYRFLRQEAPLDEALEQLTYKYGHVKSGKTGVLDHFFEIYRTAALEDGVLPNKAHFLDWVATDYDRDSVTRSFRAGTFGSLLTEIILRRE